MRKTTLAAEVSVLNVKQMTLSYKGEKMTKGRELRARNRKEMALGHK